MRDVAHSFFLHMGVSISESIFEFGFFCVLSFLVFVICTILFCYKQYITNSAPQYVVLYNGYAKV